MKRSLYMILMLCIGSPALAQFTVSTDKHFVLKDGKPFFWLADTAWELFHRLDLQDADRYLKRRSEQGFNVIQAVVLAELDGLHEPNANGDMPLIDDDPTKPNERYFKHIDDIIDKAAGYGLNIALLPTWGDKLFKSSWGIGPEILNEKNAATYAFWLASRYKNKKNIIWVIGGDRQPRGVADIAVWNAMGKAIMKATNNKALITFHCQPNQLGSAEWFGKESWFGFNMFQNGHCRNQPVYDKIFQSYSSTPAMPVIDGEPIYEDIAVCFNAADLGTSSAYDVRMYAYLDLFAGAFGHTYGCNDIWQMNSPKHTALFSANFYWYNALELPGAMQMRFVRKLIESHLQLTRVPDQSVIKENNLMPAERIQATRGDDYAYIYTVAGKSFTVLPGKIAGKQLNAKWFDPRTGKVTEAGTVDNLKENKFDPPSSGYGNDWVLILDDAAKKYQLD
nr:glycoside hydrolase family 140 protein [Mucilaginibacter sp. L294]